MKGSRYVCFFLFLLTAIAAQGEVLDPRDLIDASNYDFAGLFEVDLVSGRVIENPTWVSGERKSHWEEWAQANAPITLPDGMGAKYGRRAEKAFLAVYGRDGESWPRILYLWNGTHLISPMAVNGSFDPLFAAQKQAIGGVHTSVIAFEKGELNYYRNVARHPHLRKWITEFTDNSVITRSTSAAGDVAGEVLQVGLYGVRSQREHQSVVFLNGYVTLDELPRILKQNELDYPEELRLSSIEGHARVKILLDTNGIVTKAEVLEANHPLFGEAAAAAAVDSLFEPPMRDGIPFEAYFILPVRFELYGGKGEQVFEIAPERTVQPFPYDVAPEIKRFIFPVFPTEKLSSRSVVTKVRVMWFIDEAGNPVSPVAEKGVDPVFARAAEAAIRYWKFHPGFLNDSPAVTALAYDLVFSKTSFSRQQISQSKAFVDGKLDLANPDDLDEPLRFQVFEPIVRPREPGKERGSATIRVMVDRDGTVKYPVIEETDNEALAWSIVTGMMQNRFYPPTVNGRPVRIQFRQRFEM